MYLGVWGGAGTSGELCPGWVGMGVTGNSEVDWGTQLPGSPGGEGCVWG